MTTLVVIPARWGSTRLPGKPLALIGGRTLLSRAVDLARRALKDATAVKLVVATDDRRIASHCEQLGCEAVVTSGAIASGSGRALAAARMADVQPRYVVNLQGDAPFVPVTAIRSVIHELTASGAECATPVVRLTWRQLDELKAHKKQAPASGTTCVGAADGRALWFSKQVLPYIRDEQRLQTAQDRSPVLRHLGLYGYSLATLERFEATPPTALERIEGLEQLRLLEMGVEIRLIEVEGPTVSMGGIDTLEDIGLAESLIARHGDPFGR